MRRRSLLHPARALAVVGILALAPSSAFDAIVGPWSPAPVVVNPAGEGVFVDTISLVVGPDGTAVAAWADQSTDLVEAAVRPAGAIAWGLPTTLGTVGDVLLREPRAAVSSDGTVAVAWSERSQASAVGSAHVAVLARGSSQWDASADLTAGDAARSMFGPDVAFGAAGLVVTWWRFNTSDADLLAAIRRPGDASFGPTVTVAAGVPVGGGNARVVADRAGAVTVVWSSGADPSQVYAATRDAGASTWGLPTPVSSAGAPNAPWFDFLGLAPAAAVASDGTVSAVWRRNGSIEVASRAPHGSWSSPTTISSGSSVRGAPSIAVDDAGGAVATWSDYAGSTVLDLDSAVGQLVGRPPGSALWGTGRSGYGPAALAPDGTLAAVDRTTPTLGLVALQLPGDASPRAATAATAASAITAIAIAPDGVVSTLDVHSDGTNGRLWATSTALPAPTAETIPAVTVTSPSAFARDLHCAAGTWIDARATSISWLRNGAAIAGETDPLYHATTLDAGAALQCLVTASNATGSSTSASLPVALPGAPVALGDPRIVGVARVGGVVSCSTPGFDVQLVSDTYQWVVDGVPGASAVATYTPTAADLGHVLQCRDVIRYLGGTISLLSPGVIVLRGVAPVNVARPRITGVARVGKTLACTAGAWSVASSYTYQWLRAGKAIRGATRSTYRLVAGDRKRPVACRVTATPPGSASATVASLAVRVS